jgi:hypothetical protein
MKHTLLYIRHPWTPPGQPPHPRWQVWRVTEEPDALRHRWISAISHRTFDTPELALAYATKQLPHLRGRGHQRITGPETFTLDPTPHHDLSPDLPWPATIE